MAGPPSNTLTGRESCRRFPRPTEPHWSPYAVERVCLKHARTAHDVGVSASIDLPWSTMSTTGRKRPERTLQELLDDDQTMELLQAVADQAIDRGPDPRCNTPMVFQGRTVNWALRRLADEDLVRLQIGGPPVLWGHAEQLLATWHARRQTGRHRAIDAGGRLLELAPAACPAGHPLGRGLTGWRPCLCRKNEGHTGHRTWACQQVSEVASDATRSYLGVCLRFR